MAPLSYLGSLIETVVLVLHRIYSMTVGHRERLVEKKTRYPFSSIFPTCLTLKQLMCYSYLKWNKKKQRGLESWHFEERIDIFPTYRNGREIPYNLRLLIADRSFPNFSALKSVDHLF